MKRIFTLCAILYGGVAAADVTLYYYTDGPCSGGGKLYLEGATSCEDFVTGIKPASLPSPQNDRFFSGYYIGNTQIFDATGMLNVNADFLKTLPDGATNRTVEQRFGPNPNPTTYTLTYSCAAGCTGSTPDPVTTSGTYTLSTACAGTNQTITWDCGTGHPVTDGAVNVNTNLTCTATCSGGVGQKNYVEMDLVP